MDALFPNVNFLKAHDSKETVTVESVAGEGKVLGLYFSAHWCPPCRAFTPNLASWYEKFKKTPNGNKFEIVFVSSDRDEGSFKSYYAEMPWLALPYNNRAMKDTLSKKFKIGGIPTLVLLNGETGKVISTDGRSIVMEDEDGKEFPWIPKKVSEIIAGKLVNNEGVATQWSDLEADAVGIYFSAHWCGPCRAFTPELVKFYKKIKGDSKKFEIIFVSSDREEDSMKEYFDSMPWLAVPYGDDRKKALSRTFKISGIPTLVIIDKNGDTITTQGRSAVSHDPDGIDFPWCPKPVNQLVGGTSAGINDYPSLIWYSEKDKTDTVKTTLEGIAKEYKAALKRGEKKKEEDVLFYYCNDESEDDTWESLRSFAGVPKQKETLAFINVPYQEVYVHDGEIDEAAIEKVLRKFNSSELESKKLPR